MKLHMAFGTVGEDRQRSHLPYGGGRRYLSVLIPQPPPPPYLKKSNLEGGACCPAFRNTGYTVHIVGRADSEIFYIF
jgi:hypothetical protein